MIAVGVPLILHGHQRLRGVGQRVGVEDLFHAGHLLPSESKSEWRRFGVPQNVRVSSRHAVNLATYIKHEPSKTAGHHCNQSSNRAELRVRHLANKT